MEKDSKVVYCKECGGMIYFAKYEGISEADKTEIDKELAAFRSQGHRTEMVSAETVRQTPFRHAENCSLQKPKFSSRIDLFSQNK